MKADRALIRCSWATGVPAFYVRYHDEEWGVPCFDEAKMFEMLILEGAQAGLSWRTVLARREAYRRAFDGFAPERIARYDARKIEALLAPGSGIIRNRLKVQAAVSNARALLDLRERAARPERALTDLFWSFVDGRPKQNAWRRPEDVPATTPVSDALSRELRRLGFKFVGSTIVYAHMQACGLVNDHLVTCICHAPVRAMGQALDESVSRHQVGA
ncbi:MAG: DNA-3-methyladenine glycosylase I [Casimicrobiaceae bacterium]